MDHSKCQCDASLNRHSKSIVTYKMHGTLHSTWLCFMQYNAKLIELFAIYCKLIFTLPTCLSFNSAHYIPGILKSMWHNFSDAIQRATELHIIA